MSKEITFQEVQKAFDIINKYRTQGKRKFQNVTADTNILDTNLSVRALNYVRGNKEHFMNPEKEPMTVGDLSGLSLSKLFSFRNVGKKTVEEIKDLCFSAGIQLSPEEEIKHD